MEIMQKYDLNQCAVVAAAAPLLLSATVTFLIAWLAAMHSSSNAAGGSSAQNARVPILSIVAKCCLFLLASLFFSRLVFACEVFADNRLGLLRNKPPSNQPTIYLASQPHIITHIYTTQKRATRQSRIDDTPAALLRSPCLGKTKLPSVCCSMCLHVRMSCCCCC